MLCALRELPWGSGYTLVCVLVSLEAGPTRAPGHGRVTSDGARAGAAGRVAPMNDVTRILSAIEQGDPQAAEQLLPLVYDELRKLAAQRLAQREARPDPPGHGPGPRGVPPAGRRRAGPALERPRPLLRRRRRGHAPHPRRERPPQATPQARRRPAAGRRSTPPTLAAPTARPTTCSPSTRPSTGSAGEDPPGGRAGQAPLLRRPDRSSEAAAALGHLAAQPPTGTGPTPAPGCSARWAARPPDAA